MATPTLPDQLTTVSISSQTSVHDTTTTPAAPCSTPASHAPSKTASPQRPSASSQSSLFVSLPSIIVEGGGRPVHSQDPGLPPQNTPGPASHENSKPYVVPVVGTLGLDPVVSSVIGEISSDSTGGVVLKGHTLEINSIQTLGSGTQATTVNVYTSNDSTYIALGNSATLMIQPTRTKSPAQPTKANDPVVSEVNPGTIVVDGQTLALHSPITVTENGSPLTVQMLTSKGKTFIALGTTKTVRFGETPASTKIHEATYAADSMTFTAGADGDLIIDGKTIRPGHVVTLKSGSEEITVGATSLREKPAVVIDGTTTEILRPVSSSRLSGSSAHTFPTAGSTSEPVANNAAATSSTSTQSSMASAPAQTLNMFELITATVIMYLIT